MKDLYYFAHPYTSKDKRAEKANFNLCCIRTAKLIEMGYYVYSPIAHTHPIHRAWPPFIEQDERDLWINLDNLIIHKTDFAGIILAPGWEKSRGCCEEKAMFKLMNKPILLYGDLVQICLTGTMTIPGDATSAEDSHL